MAASPAFVRASVPCKRTAPVKRASVRQAVSQSPGWWAISTQTKTNPAQYLIVEEERLSVEGTPDPRSQPQRREGVLEILRRAKPNSPSRDNPASRDTAMSKPNGLPTTVDRCQKHQTLPPADDNKESGSEEDPDPRPTMVRRKRGQTNQAL